ncbi:protein-tyrosine phosphatase-like protein [Mycena rosella]|uniref:protein-tyrosine-phosphatase n=1 Tax=Mycena rosella TaxID=1033263 RepID=A0AAD7DVL6_MYCRO|nr:protein-tyrosine phosphatase-like protein [Mycena rosella]
MIYDGIPPSVDEVLKEQIYLGNLSAAESVETKTKLGITHILSVCPEYASTGAHHLVIPVDDSEYDDLLIHLPNACDFIGDAVAHGGRVLIHCVMGVSRSTTVRTCLMKNKSLTAPAAISFIKQCRPRVQPNYGFVKQLETFAECGCAPTPTHPAYISWKRKHKQDATNFLNRLIDTTVIIPEALFLSSDFPSEPDQVELLLIDLGVTHLLSFAPAEKVSPPSPVHHRHINIPAHAPDELLLVLPDACSFIRDAVAAGGKVLVYSLLEARACIVAGAYLMRAQNISPESAAVLIQDALPLFDPTLNFTRALSLFGACNYKPSVGAIATHGGCVAWHEPLPHPHSRATDAVSNPAIVSNAALRNPDLITSTAASVMSETGIDMRAFGDALMVIQQKAGLVHAATA